ncbi:MAG: DUF4349 domain-containing protein [Lachnospiraceae bacterium]|nr:DUF4349 domain-containing protein [Lachnospiraceae bacterium]
MKKNIIKKFLFTALLATTLCATACGNSSPAADRSTKGATYEAAAIAAGDSYYADYSNDASMGMYEAEAYDYEESYDSYAETPAADNSTGDVDVQESAQSTNRKLIRTVSLNVETQEFEALRNDIESRIKALGGYVEDGYVYNGNIYSEGSLREATMTVRIPSDKLEEFLNMVAENSNVVTQNESVRDVTLDYVDMDSRKSALKAEEKRLLEMLESADTVEDMIYIEDRLANIRYETESIESQLRTYDNLVDYSTVNLTISEVIKLTEVVEEPTVEPTVAERISKGFSESLEDVEDELTDCFVGFIISLPYLAVVFVPIIVVIVVIVVIVLIIVKVATKSSKKKKAASAAKAVEEKKDEKKEEKAADASAKSDDKAKDDKKN